MVFFFAAIGCGGRAPARKTPQAAAPPQAAYLERGLSFAREGDHLRAEQYLLAAVREGAPWEEVIVPLVESCVQGGRLKNALSYVRRHAERHPARADLHHLAAILSLGLEKMDWARYHVRQLVRTNDLSPSQLLFLGDYFADYQSDWSRARKYYEAYLLVAPERGPAEAIRALLAVQGHQEGELTFRDAEHGREEQP